MTDATRDALIQESIRATCADSRNATSTHRMSVGRKWDYFSIPDEYLYSAWEDPNDVLDAENAHAVVRLACARFRADDADFYGHGGWKVLRLRWSTPGRKKKCPE